MNIRRIDDRNAFNWKLMTKQAEFYQALGLGESISNANALPYLIIIFEGIEWRK